MEKHSALPAICFPASKLKLKWRSLTSPLVEQIFFRRIFQKFSGDTSRCWPIWEGGPAAPLCFMAGAQGKSIGWFFDLGSFKKVATTIRSIMMPLIAPFWPISAHLLYNQQAACSTRQAGGCPLARGQQTQFFQEPESLQKIPQKHFSHPTVLFFWDGKLTQKSWNQLGRAKAPNVSDIQGAWMECRRPKGIMLVSFISFR